jgi:hypothetical protein
MRRYLKHSQVIYSEIKLMNSQANPLSMYMRQPKIYIRLPSGGNYWPTGSLDISENGEYSVYSMTAKDELLLKIPDALMNGQAVTDVIQHCIPNIKNAWHVPAIDLDVILIAIRLATYGEMMTVPVTVGDSLQLDYQVDLRVVMDQLLNQISWDPIVPISDELTVFVKPVDYKSITKSAIQSFETEKIIQMVNNDKISEEDKVKLFQESFKKISDATLGSVSGSISRIDSNNGSTDNPQHIQEFVDNIDKEIFNKIQTHLEILRDKNAIKPMKVEVTEEMKGNGVTSETIEIPITFDPSTFFV